MTRAPEKANFPIGVIGVKGDLYEIDSVRAALPRATALAGPTHAVERSANVSIFPRVSILCCLIGFAALLADAARGETIVFPAGWAVADLPAAMPNGQRVDGGTRRAMLADTAGKFVAAIELTTLPQPPGRLWDKAAAMQTTQDAAGDVVRQNGLAYTCDASAPIRVAATDGLVAECQIQRAGSALVRQRIVVWSPPGMLSSLSYSTAIGSFAAHQAAFEQTLASIQPE